MYICIHMYKKKKTKKKCAGEYIAFVLFCFFWKNLKLTLGINKEAKFSFFKLIKYMGEILKKKFYSNIWKVARAHITQSFVLSVFFKDLLEYVHSSSPPDSSCIFI